MGCGVWGVGCGVWGFGVWGEGLGVWCCDGVWGLRFGVWGLGFTAPAALHDLFLDLFQNQLLLVASLRLGVGWLGSHTGIRRHLVNNPQVNVHRTSGPRRCPNKPVTHVANYLPPGWRLGNPSYSSVGLRNNRPGDPWVCGINPSSLKRKTPTRPDRIKLRKPTREA